MTAQEIVSNLRIIARLDVKVPFLVKGVQFEGLKKIGDPNEVAEKYYLEGVDEILFEDVVASLHEQNRLLEIAEQATNNVFVPITVGGGIKNLWDVEKVLKSGADKISINTAAVQNPDLITEIAKEFGSQCVTLSIQAKHSNLGWEAFTNNGREKTQLEAVEWAKRGQNLGAGEILVTSVDFDGTGKGFDVELLQAIRNEIHVPLIASGGAGTEEHVLALVKAAGVDAVAIGHAFHFGLMTVESVKEYLSSSGIPVRQTNEGT